MRVATILLVAVTVSLIIATVGFAATYYVIEIIFTVTEAYGPSAGIMFGVFIIALVFILFTPGTWGIEDRSDD